jgi:hypothetical protein
MDFTRLSQGEKVAGVSGILLILFMFIFDWFGLKAGVSLNVPGVGGFSSVGEGSRNAWGSYGFIDIVLFITAVAAIGLALLAASEGDVGLPVAASAVVAGLGILSVVLVIISIISPPDFGFDLSGTDIDHTRKIGVWLGLIAAAGVAVGGYMAMQEEGTSFGSEAGRFGGGGDAGSGSPPPPPPTSSAPPPSSPPPSNP